MIDGGAGRVICAIPALENYLKNNPDDDFKILVSGWSLLLHSHPTLASRVFATEEPNVFTNHILHNRCVHVEPYHLYEYYHDHISLSCAFDILINNSSQEDYKVDLYVDPHEDTQMLELIEEFKLTSCKDKVVVIQPFGSSSILTETSEIVDPSGRGLPVEVLDQIVDQISKEAIVVYFGVPELWKYTNKKTHHIFPINPSLRDYMALVANCDYFIGCDSVGQHMARSFDKKGTVLMGGTFESNVSYPNYENFKFYRKPGTRPVFNPMRISPESSMQAEEANKDLMNFTPQEVNSIVSMIMEHMHV